ncbi:extracellular solute-binding protein [Paenibacillus sp. J5C_2022]|uniref:ABC transporter substrate-binding protein n=1 Tax=Paenibacillus sp. J5C2022 TaxID=2977129 RepID=UPI0021D173E6|nr:extracellular solute-binding protein [Paenibacillus sp. J5C2022]MCU6707429.1 extracellular solute-binding protein [Paenibacillus sp. J5C2022]
MNAKKKALTWICLVLMLGLLAGCAGNGDNKNNEPSKPPAGQQEENGQSGKGSDTADGLPKTEKPVSLKLYTTSAVDKTEFDEIIGEWKKVEPNIDVEMVVLSGQDSQEKIRVAIAGGEKIDLAMMERTTFSDKADKLYYKLNDLMEQEGLDYLKEYGDYGKATMVGDDIYGIAKVLSPGAVYVNKEMFEKNGVPIPDDNTWTYEDYFKMIKDLTVKDSGGRTQVRGGMHWQGSFLAVTDLASIGGWDIVNEDGTPNLDSPILRKSIHYYYDAMYVDGSMPTDADVQANKVVGLFDFVGEKFATLIGASNSILFLDVWKEAGHLDPAVDDRDPFLLLKMPRWDENSPPNQITTIVTSYSVTRTTEHPVEAYKFLRWYTTKGLELSAKVAHRVPAWQGADEELLMDSWRYYKNNDGEVVQGKDRKELYQRALDKSANVVFPKYRGQYPYSSMLLEELKKELSLILADEKSIEQGLQDAQAAGLKIYEREK